MSRVRHLLGIWLLRPEIEAKVVAARTLSQGAYRDETSTRGKRGRAWWQGYERGLEALIEGKGL